MQIGMGVKNGSISTLFNQGTLESTNNEFDFAIQGNGFFVLDGGDKNFFTRVGTFATDSSNHLVDSTSGYQILDSSGKTITIPYDSSVSATKTSSITLTGTLEATPSDTSGEVVLLSSALTYNSGTVATASTSLNALDTNTTNYSTNDTITVSGTLPDGTSFSDDFLYGTDGTTVNDFMNWLSNQSTTLNNTATVSLSNGKIIVTSNTAGNDDLSVTITDKSTDTGTWADYDFLASTYTTSTTIYDAQGTGHNVTMTFIKKSDGVWDMRASMESSDGTISDTTISSITFNDDGSLQSAGDSTLTFKFDGMSSSQNVTFNIGTFGKTDGIYQSGNGSSVTASSQDGSEAGNFSSFSVDTDGTLYAMYSNGTEREIAQLQVALFGNVQGLRKAGDNLFEQTDSSGGPLYTVGNTGSAGQIYNGYLEASNVDMTAELTSLIMAQRGFQLNSRVITTADEVLAEAVNLKR